MVENFGDAPFCFSCAVHTVAAMARIAAEVVEAAAGVPVGINVLRNDAQAAMGIAAASGASFVRVNVLSGAMLTDQGLIEGQAAELLRLRRQLEATEVGIFADVLVKHAYPLAPQPIAEGVEDCLGRAGADGVIVSGVATGAALIQRSSGGPLGCWQPLLIGSGCHAGNASSLGASADGVIVASSLKRDGLLANPVDPCGASPTPNLAAVPNFLSKEIKSE